MVLTLQRVDAVVARLQSDLPVDGKDRNAPADVRDVSDSSATA